MATGFIIGFRYGYAMDKYVYLLGNVIFAILMGILHTFLWLPELIADVASYITYKTR
jgi:uncharacterized membrane protein (Fun14 family)